MALPRLAKHFAQWSTIDNDEITAAMLKDDDDYTMGSLALGTTLAVTGAVTLTEAMTMATTKALTLDTIAAITGKALVVSGADGFDVKVKLGDDDGTESFIIEEVDGDDLFKVDSLGAVTAAGTVTMATTKALTLDTIAAISAKDLTISGADGQDVIIKLGDDDGNEEFRVQEVDGDNIFYVDSDKNIKLLGEVSTRNTADDSMYYSIPASASHERGMKVAYDIVSNDGGYFDALYANVRSGGVTGGELRAIEAKASIAHDMANNAIATGVYAKVAVANAAQIDTAYGVDVLLEETGTGAITKGVGIRVQGGAGAIDHAADFSGLYRNMAIKLPYATAAGEAAANFVTAFGTSADGDTAGDSGIVGIFLDSGDSSLHMVVKVEGRYGKIAISDA